MSDPYNKDRFSGFSLWIQPPNDVCKSIFEPLIEHYAKKYGGETFEPHITLLAPIEHLSKDEIISRLEQLKSIPRFEVRIDRASYADKYFQCVFALCCKSHELIQAHETAKDVMFKENSELSPSTYMPHLSIVYGNLTTEQREEVCHEIEGTVNDVTFEIKSISLWNTQGKPNEWTKVTEVALS